LADILNCGPALDFILWARAFLKRLATAKKVVLDMHRPWLLEKCSGQGKIKQWASV
jgi:hypothetical protein